MGIFFVAILIALFLARIIKKDSEYSAMENRVLQGKAELTVDSIMNGQYESQTETYISDQFPLRNAWIRVKTSADILLGKREENGVFLGKSGFLLEDFENSNDKKENEKMDALTGFASEHSDLKQYFLLAPTAVNILDEKLPAFADAGEENAYMDQVFSKTQSAGITNIDLRETFEKADKESLYYKTDHHWTTAGAYLAFQTSSSAMGITQACTYEPCLISNTFNGSLASKSGMRTTKKENIYAYLPDDTCPESLVVYPGEDDVKSNSFYEVDKLEEKDKYTVFFGGNHSLMKIETPTEDNKRILVLKDSYANCFLPFLAPYYRHMIVVDPRYYDGDLQTLIDEEQIQEILYLYNASTFSLDTSLAGILPQGASPKS